MKVLWKPVFHLELVLLNHRSEFTVATCLKANMKLNVAIWACRGTSTEQINTSLSGFSSCSMEVDKSYNPAVTSSKYLKITDWNLK